MKCTHTCYRKNKDGIGYTSYPCGQCIACRLNKVRDWTIRLMHENRFHKDSVFLTLTYDQEHLPEDHSVHKEDVQKFMKRLRNYCPNVRFFACGEYGERYSRPHYHLIIFGLSIDNPIFKGKVYDRKSKGYYLLSPLWKNGNMYVGSVTYSSCRYVASYVNKKQFGKKGQEFYKNNGIEPEFTLMSRRPGIGAEFVNFTKLCSSEISELSSMESLRHYLDTMRIKFLILKSLRELEKPKKKLTVQLRRQTLRLSNGTQIFLRVII